MNTKTDKRMNDIVYDKDSFAEHTILLASRQGEKRAVIMDKEENVIEEQTLKKPFVKPFICVIGIDEDGHIFCKITDVSSSGCGTIEKITFKKTNVQ